MTLDTLESVARYAFPGLRVRVAVPFDRDEIHVYVLARCRRGKRQHSQYYARGAISGYVFTKWPEKAVPVVLEDVRLLIEDKLEMARLVGWKVEAFHSSRA